LTGNDATGFPVVGEMPAEANIGVEDRSTQIRRRLPFDEVDIVRVRLLGKQTNATILGSVSNQPKTDAAVASKDVCGSDNRVDPVQTQIARVMHDIDRARLTPPRDGGVNFKLRSDVVDKETLARDSKRAREK